MVAMVAVVAGVGVVVVAVTKVGARAVGGCSAVLRGALVVVVGSGAEQRDCATAVHGRLSPRRPVEQVTDAEALRLAELHPHALHLVHQPMGHTGHYSLLWGEGHKLRCGNQHHGCKCGTGKGHEPYSSTWV